MKISSKKTVKLILLIGLVFSILTGCSDNLMQKYEKYNVIWDSQSKDSWGSMPVGNGDIGANVWVTADGELQFFISKTDAFSENARLLKIGKVKFTPNILSGKDFKQELDLYSGKIKITIGETGQKAALDFWIDANHPAIVIEGKCDVPVTAEVSYEGWRNRRRELTQKEMHSAYGLFGSPDPVYVEPDTVLRRQAELLWCHHNKRSIWKNVLELQALGELTHQLDDPLLNRTFGALVYGKNLNKASDIKLVSSMSDKKFNLSVIVNTEFAENAAVWAQDISDLKMEIEKQSIVKRKQAHDNWWKSFWNRHYLFIDSETQPKETFTVTHGYLLQRYINACGGRGKLPIKFNGSIFTVDVVNDFYSSGVNLKGMDADYRPWGGCYWWQNTRFPYWSMLYSGDFEMMKPLFKMYLDALPLLKYRTRKYYGHDGAFCSETMYSWGTYNNANYGWNREGMPDGLTQNMYIRYYWQSGIELVAMMQDYYFFTGDTDFLNNQLTVFAREILTFYNEHYLKDEAGKIVIFPAQSLETYWEGTINPLPEIAGLKFITERFLKMDKLTSGNPFISLCKTVRNSLPEIPVRQDDDGQQLLSPAQVLTWKKRNSENPELYAVFPCRLCGQGKPNLDIARNTFKKRLHKQFSGWQQNAIQAALLGLTGEAQRMIVHNFGKKHEGSRFPAFWGPNYDWIPDQCHGNVNMRALQNMLVQDVDGKIHLFTALPKEWNVAFKVHAPQNTIIEGKFEDGELKKLIVAPKKRREDVIIKNDQ